MQNQYSKKRRSKLLGIALTAFLLQACGDSEQFVFTNTGAQNNPNPPVTAPLAVNDAFPALGNATLDQAASGVLTNDTLNGATITDFDSAGSAGGALQLESDGSFTYTPAVGFVGAETFSYTIANDGGSSTATVTLTSTGLGFFVDNQAPGGGDGSQASPFNNLAAAVAAAEAGDTIFVGFGDGSGDGLTGAINLKAGVDLIGEGAGLVAAQTIVPVGSRPTITGPVNCGGDNTISGFNIEGSASEGIVINEVDDVRVVDNIFGECADRHIFANEASGTIEILDNTFSVAPTASTDYIYAENGDLDRTASFNINDNTFLNPTSALHDSLVEFSTFGTNAVNIQYLRNTADGTAVDMFQYGFFVYAYENADVTVDVSDNSFVNHDFYAIAVFGDTAATVGGAVNRNMVDLTTEYGIYLGVNGDTMTVDGNQVSSTDSNGIHMYFDDLGGNYLVQNNQVTNSTGDGIYLEGYVLDSVAAILNNTITNSGSRSFYALWNSANVLCLNISGNIVNDDMFIEEAGAGEIDVFQRDSLGSLNTFNGGTTATFSGMVNEVTEACLIP